LPKHEFFSNHNGTIFQSNMSFATEHVYPLQMHHGKPMLSITSIAQGTTSKNAY